MAVVFSRGWQWLVVAVAAPFVDYRRSAFAFFLKCLFDVDADDIGNDVDDCCTSAEIATQCHSKYIATDLVGVRSWLFDHLVRLCTCRLVNAVDGCRTRFV